MAKPIKKIGLILLILIILPILFISIREISSLNENESLIESIYTKQLESILYSVNQYSEDVARSWLTRIQSMVDEADGTWKLPEAKTKQFFETNYALNYFFLADSSGRELKTFQRPDALPRAVEDREKIKLVLKENQSMVSKLYKFKSGKFTKIYPVADMPGSTQIMVFILDNKMTGGFAIDKSTFVRQNLSSIIQSIGREEFVVTVFDVNSKEDIYSTERTKISNYQQKKNLWLIPDYSLGISLKGKSLEDLVKSGMYKNLFMMLGLSMLMLIFAWFVYRNFKQEVELAQIKSDFVSNVSHELRTPLALIHMYAETLTMGRVKSEEKRDEYYGIIQQETERLSKIVNRILNFSKIESGKWKYNFTANDLNEITGQIYTSYKFHLGSKGFDFQFEPAEHMPVTVMDKEAVSESLINLIDNAVKYSSDRKKIIVRTGVMDKSVFVEIEDNGIGIAVDDQKKIFDKFYRVPTEDVHNAKGTGLGLTLVKHIVDAHKGEIRLNSRLGKGTTFRLIFPVNTTHKEA